MTIQLNQVPEFDPSAITNNNVLAAWLLQVRSKHPDMTADDAHALFQEAVTVYTQGRLHDVDEILEHLHDLVACGAELTL